VDLKGTNLESVGKVNGIDGPVKGTTVALFSH
jgi:hypothetical protein